MATNDATANLTTTHPIFTVLTVVIYLEKSIW